MAKQDINIINGHGVTYLRNGSYNASAKIAGYNIESLAPKQVTISAGVEAYSFTISAIGALTIHVTEDGTAGGTPVENAVFYRTDSTGTKYGYPITTDAQGYAILQDVPYGTATNPVSVYFVQTASDGEHEFTTEVKSVQMTTSAQTVEITNAPSTAKAITITDANYANLPIEAGTLTLESQI